MRTFRYGSAIRWYVMWYRASGVVIVALALSVGAFSLYWLLVEPAEASWILVFAVGWISASAIAGPTLAYSHPDIQIDEEGLRLASWPFPTIRVGWDDLEALFEAPWPRDRTLFIQARRLTPLHSLYGLYYVGRWLPGILVRKEIQGFEGLRRKLGSRQLPTILLPARTK